MTWYSIFELECALHFPTQNRQPLHASPRKWECACVDTIPGNIFRTCNIPVNCSQFVVIAFIIIKWPLWLTRNGFSFISNVIMALRRMYANKVWNHRPCKFWTYPDNEVPAANMGPTWVLSAPDGPHVGPRNHGIRVALHTLGMLILLLFFLSLWLSITIPLRPPLTTVYRSIQVLIYLPACKYLICLSICLSTSSSM